MTALRDIRHDVKNGHLGLGPGDYEDRAAVFGARRAVPVGRTPAEMIARAGAGTCRPASATIQVGEAPDGFGKWVGWNPADSALALVVFLSAADPLGVGIHGVTAGDTVELVAAVGVAAFSEDTETEDTETEDTENEGVSSIVGILAAGAGAVATVYGAPRRCR